MPINQKNKIIIASLAFLIVGILIFWKTDEGISVWDILNPRPGPISITHRMRGTPLPVTSGRPVPPPDYFGLLPWAVRLASKEMPHVEGVVWKTYTNKEYGFEMQYPEGRKISIDINGGNARADGVYERIYFSFILHDTGKWDYRYLTLALLHHRNKDLAEYLKRLYKENKESYGDNGPIFIKTIVINNINWLVNDTDAYIQSPMYAEKNHDIYLFGDTSFPTRNERMIAEYMVKSFHFIQ